MLQTKQEKGRRRPQKTTRFARSAGKMGLWRWTGDSEPLGLVPKQTRMLIAKMVDDIIHSLNEKREVSATT